MRGIGTRFRRYAVVVLLALVAAGPAEAAEKGVVPDLTWGTSRAEVDRTVALLRDSGARWVRTNVSWSGAEPRRGRYNEGWLADVDYAVAAARRAGIEVLMPISDGVPYWASADPGKVVGPDGKERWNKYWRPRDPAEYGRFVRYVADRYTLQGVRAFEIWNEPNLARFWPSGPSAAEYVPLLRAGFEAVKAASPGATVVLGGLSRSDAGYLQSVYDAGGGRWFDVAAVHPYTVADPTVCWSSIDAFCAIETVRRTMVANGDAAKELWLTEYGWSSSPLAPWSVDEARQADYVAKALAKLETYPYVTKAFYYGFRNLWWEQDDPREWGANLGLLRTDFSPKPAYYAFRDHRPAAPAAQPVAQPSAKPKPPRKPKRRR